MNEKQRGGGSIIELTPDQPAYVSGLLVEIDEEAEAWTRANLERQGGVDLESGPYASFRVMAPWDKSSIYAGLYANRGGVETHRDDAGHTLGLVLIAEGNHHLVVDGKRWPLKPGSVYHINSDQDHATECDDPNGLIAIITLDFGWKKSAPTDLTYLNFAEEFQESYRLFTLRTPID